MRKKCILECVMLMVLAVMLAWGTGLERQQQRIADEIIRLHVIANSDSERDQWVKMQVRDTVLSTAEILLRDSGNAQCAREELCAHLTLLEEAANEKLKEIAPGETAQVGMCRKLFGTRYYDGFSLPGGYYDALCVTIGSGEGKNWWCVVYPQICMSGTVEQQRIVAAMGGMTEEDVDILQQETPEYQFKFKTLEIFENILGWFRGRETGIPTSG